MTTGSSPGRHTHPENDSQADSDNDAIANIRADKVNPPNLRTAAPAKHDDIADPAPPR